MDNPIHFKSISHFTVIALIIATILVFFTKTAPAQDLVTQPSVENATWEIFTNRSLVQALAFSKDGTKLWVGSRGGIEQWDVANQKLLYFDNSNLPQSYITALAIDRDDGLWVGTEQGLAYRNPNGQWSRFNRENSQLPSINIFLR